VSSTTRTDGRALALAAIATFVASASVAGLSRIEVRGKEIYMHGASASAAITATLDAGSSKVETPAMPCASCHGRDGRGRVEGGVTPSDITFAALHRAYAVTTPSGRTHGPYDDRALRRAITEGIDPAGNRLDSVMPRYAMARPEFEALSAYLRRLGGEVDDGISETRLRLGVILPPQRTMPDASVEMRAIVSAWFDDVNRRGGIFGRSVELRFDDPEGSPAARAAAVRAFVDREAPFALVSSFSEGAEREIADVAEEKQIPFVATMTSNPRSSAAPGRYVRELFAGISEESRALVRAFARERPETKRLVIVGSEALLAQAGEAVARDCRDAGCAAIETLTPRSPALATLHERGVNGVVVLDAESLEAVLPLLRQSGSSMTLLAPASVVDPARVTGAEFPSLLAFPTLPNDYNDSSSALHARFLDEHRIGRTHRVLQAAGLASASLVTDALMRVGRTLSREAFLDAIDQTTAFRSGFAPPMTFRADRHIGSTGAWVIALEPGRPARAAWVETP